MKLAICVVALAVAVARPASAHPLDIGYLRIDGTGDKLAIVLDVDLRVAARLLGVPPAALDSATLQSRASELAGLTYRSAPITTGGAACTWGTSTVELRDRNAVLTDVADCRSGTGTLHWPLPFITRVSPTFQLLTKTHTSAGDHVAIVDKNQPSLELEATASTVRFTDFVWTGVEHIGVAPSEWHGKDGLKFPDGIDHILFVLALLLAGGSIKQLAGITSGFTVGHSITLALSTLDIVRPPASVIEPLIALSIAIVAAEALSGKLPKYRWKVATFFGLIHGFGMAGALHQLDLSAGNTVKALFGYNVGVEIGQLVIILLVAPLVVLAHRNAYSKVVVARIAPALILFAGLFWFVQRIVH